MFGLTEVFVALLLAAGSCAASHDQDPFLLLPPGRRPDENVAPLPKDLGRREFSLRHIYHHGAHRYPKLHRYIDVAKDAELAALDEHGAEKPAATSFTAQAVSMNIQRLADRKQSAINGLLEHADVHGRAATVPAAAWTVDEISGPNTTDKATVVSFAWMAANAYVPKPNKGDWQDVGGGYNYTESFGWELDGLRGHIFADETNSTVVIGLKGTSMAVFDGAETTGHDKENDNLFASCCAGQGGPYLWKIVGDCMSSAYSCNSTCLVKSLRRKDHYYNAARDLYHNVTERYPNADIWLSGHSLGGVVAALVGLTYGQPVMTFEAYPDALAASRLGLPVPPGYKAGSHQSRTDVGIYHYGHTADPVYMGSCNSAFALCTIGGYAMESLCHTGRTCEYDTVEDFGWRVDVTTHRILSVIPDVLEKYKRVPKCKSNPDCTDCYKWKFFESNGTEKTTTSQSSTTTRTRTRTETCKTPGWWGCLDESTTTSYTTTRTLTSTITTSICKTPGWFGCRDPVTSTYTTTVTTPKPVPAPTTSAPSSTSTCETPGWFGFGCDDETTPSTTVPPPTTIPSTSPTATETQTTSTCTSKAWFGLICLDPSPSTTTATTTTDGGVTSSPVSTTSLPPSGERKKKCIAWHWWGSCREWKHEEEQKQQQQEQQRLVMNKTDL